MFIISKLSINKPIKVSTAWPPMFTASGEIYFDNCYLSFVKKTNGFLS